MVNSELTTAKDYLGNDRRPGYRVVEKILHTSLQAINLTVLRTEPGTGKMIDSLDAKAAREEAQP